MDLRLQLAVPALRRPDPDRLLAPFQSEAAAFAFLVRVVIVLAVVMALVLGIRAIL